MATKIITATANTTTIKVLLTHARVLLLLPGIFLAGYGFAHIRDGIALDRAIPVPVYMVAGTPLPRAAYIEAAKALEGANPRDGIAALSRAEANLRAGASMARVSQIVVQGLWREPASARGWTLLAETYYPTDKTLAALALSQALLLAPRDYYLARPRALDAALLWAYLDADTRALAISQARLLWQEPTLRSELIGLAKTAAGASLLTRALKPDEIRLLNRTIAGEQGGSQ